MKEVLKVASVEQGSNVLVSFGDLMFDVAFNPSTPLVVPI